MNTNQTSTKTANDSQNIEGSPAQIVDRIARELAGTGLSLGHVRENLIPELRVALDALAVNAATVTESLLAADNRGIEYGVVEITHYSDGKTHILHRNDGYALDMETRHFAAWKGSVCGPLLCMGKYNAERISEYFNAHGFYSIVSSPGHPGGGWAVLVSVGSLVWYLSDDDQMGGNTWNASLYEWNKDRTDIGEDSFAFLDTGVPCGTTEPETIFLGFIAPESVTREANLTERMRVSAGII